MPTTADLKQVLDQLKDKVQANSDVVASAVIAFAKISQMLKDALASQGTPQEILDEVANIANEIDSDKKSLAEAVANTEPPVPEPIPVPEPQPEPEPEPEV